MSKYQLIWKTLRNGQIAIGHKPGRKLIEELKRSGCTHIVSLLSDKETGKQVKVSNHRLRLPLESAKPPDDERLPEIIALFSHLKEILDSNGKMFIHCSAGIHRTGMITHAFLRYLGYSREDALSFIQELREITALEVGEERLNWGDRFADKKSL